MVGESTKEVVVSSGGVDVDSPGACRACVGSTFVIVIGGHPVSAVNQSFINGGLIVSAFGWSALGVSRPAPSGSGMKVFSFLSYRTSHFLIGYQRRMILVPEEFFSGRCFPYYRTMDRIPGT